MSRGMNISLVFASSYLQVKFVMFIEISLGNNYHQSAGALVREVNTDIFSDFPPKDSRRVNIHLLGDGDFFGPCKMGF